MSYFVALFATRSRSSIGFIVFLLAFASIQLHAKTAGLTAIEIFPTAEGQAYQQLGDFILNGKNEVYLCGGAASFDKSAYHKLAKVALTVGMALERDESGALTLTSGTDAPACIVPGNLKLDGGSQFSVSQLADKAEVEARVLSGSAPAQSPITSLKARVKLVFVSNPDQEYAEYLRADRAADIPSWKDYLAKHESGAHAGAARKLLAALYLPVGIADLKAYQSSAAGSDPDYAKLKEARLMADQARALVPDDAAAADLNKKVHDEVLHLSSLSKEKLNLYLQAFRQQSPGYANLVAAEKLADGAFMVEPSSHDASDAETQARLARGSFDKVLSDIDGMIAAQLADDALMKIGSLKPFASENAKIAGDLKAISVLFVAHAKKLGDSADWPGAVSDLEKAVAVLSTPETLDLLKNAKDQAHIAANKAAADAAVQKSQAEMAAGNVITAYESLDNLPAEQRTLVADKLAALQDGYVEQAELAAKGEQKAHDPINGLSDEQGIQRAYGYLQRCYRLTNDPTLQFRITVLGELLSNYYLQQGKHYAEKPDGSGMNLAWAYLSEALQYKSPTNLGAINDERTTIGDAHLIKSRLSVRVEFREGTSRREAVDFAPQLTDAMATGLETAGSGVKVVRPQDKSAVQPNFQLVGEVLRHEMSKSQETVARKSKYRFGQTQVPNPQWNEVDETYEKANLDLASARSRLEGAQAHGKKKEISDAQSLVDEDQQKVQDLRKKLNSLSPTISHDEEREYTYAEVDFHLKAIVELQFRIVDSSGNEVVPRVQVQREIPTDYSVKENVKSEDTMGVRNEGAIPNENDLLEDAEYKARDELIEKAKAKVAELPAVLLSSADRKSADGDNDAAAELYILYLNSTKVADTQERMKVRKFLADQFNFKEMGKEAYSE